MTRVVIDSLTYTVLIYVWQYAADRLKSNIVGIMNTLVKMSCNVSMPSSLERYSVGGYDVVVLMTLFSLYFDTQFYVTMSTGLLLYNMMKNKYQHTGGGIRIDSEGVSNLVSRSNLKKINNISDACHKVAKKPLGYAKTVVSKYWMDIIASSVDTPVQVMVYKKTDVDYSTISESSRRGGGGVMKNVVPEGVSCTSTTSGTNVLKIINKNHTQTMFYNREIVMCSFGDGSPDTGCDSVQAGGIGERNAEWNNITTRSVEQSVVVCKVVHESADATHRMYLTKDMELVMLFTNNNNKGVISYQR